MCLPAWTVSIYEVLGCVRVLLADETPFLLGLWLCMRRTFG